MKVTLKYTKKFPFPEAVERHFCDEECGNKSVGSPVEIITSPTTTMK